MNVTAVVLTLNEEQNIEDCLASVAWTDHRVVLDSFSSDATVELARQAGAEVLQNPFENFAQQHNAALELVDAEWVLFVDADERVTPELADEIRQVTNADLEEVAWSIPRHNYIFGRLTRGAGWYPDYQTRLLLRGRVFWERPVHEVVVTDGQQGHLQNPLIHYNYRDVADFIARQNKYNQFDARILCESGVRPRVYTPFTQAVRQFGWRFFTLKGTQDGLHGLRLSLLMAYFEMKKYRQVRRLSRMGRF
jgi:glycosyltransferase involved in cell wall biosynthesis